MARGWIKDEGLRADQIIQTMRRADQLWTAYAIGERIGVDSRAVERILSDRLLPAGIVEREWGPQGALWRLVRR